MASRTMDIDPDVKITELVGRLTDDSKRLVSDEIRLAKLEVSDSVRTGSRGALWLGIAFGAGLIALVALTIFFVTVIGRLANNHMWVGGVVTGVVEAAVGAWLVMRGIHTLGKPSYTLSQSREELSETVSQLKDGVSG